MMRSMFSGVSGLRTHQSRMDVIAHNIANVNTTGFKASRMTFADAFSQTIRGASAPNPDVGRGGTNPMQIGLGVNVNSIQRMMTPGAAQRTDDPLHMMIEGDGFFVVGDDVNGLFFTRAGDFIRDANWNIMAPNGMLLQGWRSPWDAQGNPFTAEGVAHTPQRGPVQGIQIDAHMQSVPPRSTGNIFKHGNLRHTDALGENAARGIQSTVNFQDSLGTDYSMAIRYRWIPNPTYPVPAGQATGHWQVERAAHMTRTDDNERIDIVGGVNNTVVPGAPFSLAAISPPDDGWVVLSTVAFNENGNPQMTTNATPPVALPGGGGFHIDLMIDAAGLPPGVYIGQPRAGVGTAVGGVYPPSIRIDLSAMTQHSGNTNVRMQRHDGLAPGNLIGLSIGPDGIITGTYSNGQAFPLWQIAIALFDNPAGLAAMGGNLFAMTANSGGFDGIGMTPGAAGTQLLGGTLEMSNVDLAGEFTEMITTQRGFQANSRVISTSDEMLQELVNLRR